MKNRSYLTLFVLLLFISAFTCNRKANDGNKQDGEKESMTATKAADIRGDWVVQSLQLKDKEPNSYDKYYTLNITAEGLGLPLDINQCGTSYTVKKDSMIVDKFMTCTEACCDSEEAVAISKFLSGPLHFTIREDILKLSHDKGTLTLFQPANNLVGSSWEAVNYKPLDSDGKPIIFENPYILIFEPMSAILKLDVNNCSGAVAFSKEAFEIKRGLGCSRKCCDSKDGILLKDMLVGKNTYTIEGDEMRVETTDYAILFKMTEEDQED